jgi:hypothetical protein
MGNKPGGGGKKKSRSRTMAEKRNSSRVNRTRLNNREHRSMSVEQQGREERGKTLYTDAHKKKQRLSKVESISDPRYVKDMKLWMSSPDNPFAADVNAASLVYVRGVHQIENTDDLFKDFDAESSGALSVASDESSSRGLTAEKLCQLERAGQQNKVFVSSDGLGSLTTLYSTVDGTDGSAPRVTFAEALDESNSSIFHRQDEVYAFCVNDPCEFTKRWGTSRARAGDWIIVRGGHDVYANTAAKFQDDYVAIPGAANKFIKRTPVRARCMEEPFRLARASRNETDVGGAGDYVVQTGEIQYIVFGSEFKKQYQLDKSKKYSRGVVGSLPRKRTGNDTKDSALDYPMWGVQHDSVQVSTLEARKLFGADVTKFMAENANTWELDVFELGSLTKYWPLFHLGLYYFDHYDLADKIGLDRALWTSFLVDLDDAYLPNPYHSNLHAADVLGSAHYIVKATGFMEHMTSMELFSLMVACAAHDVAHPGTNNFFQVNAMSPVAIRYNDKSVLENFHAATTFEILGSPKYANMLPKEIIDAPFLPQAGAPGASGKPIAFFPFFRKYIIELILATDLSGEVANPIINAFRARARARASPKCGHDAPLDLAVPADRLLCLKMVIKCSDIGHAAKPLELHQKWSELVTEEFLMQIEKEDSLGLPHMFSVSRDPVKFSESQVGFIRFVVQPCYRDFCIYIGDAGTKFTRNIKDNISHWNEQKRSSLADKMLPQMEKTAVGGPRKKVTDRVKSDNHRAVVAHQRSLKGTFNVVESMHHIPVEKLKLGERSKQRSNSGSFDTPRNISPLDSFLE